MPKVAKKSGSSGAGGRKKSRDYTRRDPATGKPLKEQKSAAAGPSAAEKKKKKSKTAAKAAPAPKSVFDDDDVSADEEDIQFFLENEDYLKFMSKMNDKDFDKKVDKPKMPKQRVDASSDEEEGNAEEEEAESSEAESESSGDDQADDYERAPRQRTDEVLDTPSSKRLPVKDLSSGKIKKMKDEDDARPYEFAEKPKAQIKKEEEEETEEPTEPVVSDDDEDMSASVKKEGDVEAGEAKKKARKEASKPRTPQEIAIALQQAKESIATLATEVLEDPQKNLKCLKAMHEMMVDEDADKSVKQLCMLSHLAVLQDILPGYKIRLPTEKELEARISKDVRDLRTFEAGLLRAYKRFLQFLEERLKDRKEPFLRRCAAKCMGHLMAHMTHFNFRSNVIRLLIPCTIDRDREVAHEVCESVRALFREDAAVQEASLEAVHLLAQLIRDKERAVTPDVLDCFRALEIGFSLDSRKRQKTKEEEELSRLRTKFNREKNPKDRRKLLEKIKKMEEFIKHKKITTKGGQGLTDEQMEKDLREGEATVSKEDKKRIQTKMLNSIVVTYVRILKASSADSPLVFAALAGIAKFAHLINVDLLLDLLESIRVLLKRDELPSDTRLQALVATFRILTGHAEALSVDMKEFYGSLYKAIHGGLVPYSDRNARLLIEAIELMLLRPKKLPVDRVCSFVKRLAALSPYVPHHMFSSIAYVIKALLQEYPKLQQSLEEEAGTSSVYRADLDDPDHTGALSTPLWDLIIAKDHFHPSTSKYTQQVITRQIGTNLPVLSSAKTPLEVFDQLAPRETHAEAVVDIKTPQVSSKKRLREDGRPKMSSSFFASAFSTSVRETCAKGAFSEDNVFSSLVSRRVRQKTIKKEEE